MENKLTVLLERLVDFLMLKLEDGSASAKDCANIITLLKNNDITYDFGAYSQAKPNWLEKLKSGLPESDLEELTGGH